MLVVECVLSAIELIKGFAIVPNDTWHEEQKYTSFIRQVVFSVVHQDNLVKYYILRVLCHVIHEKDHVSDYGKVGAKYDTLRLPLFLLFV